LLSAALIFLGLTGAINTQILEEDKRLFEVIKLFIFKHQINRTNIMISNRDLNGESRLVSGESMEQCSPLINTPLDYKTDKVEDVFKDLEWMDDDNNSFYVRGYN